MTTIADRPAQTTLAYAARELLTALEECSCRQDDIWEALMHTRQGDVVSQTMVQLEDELEKGEDHGTEDRSARSALLHRSDEVRRGGIGRG